MPGYVSYLRVAVDKPAESLVQKGHQHDFSQAETSKNFSQTSPNKTKPAGNLNPTPLDKCPADYKKERKPPTEHGEKVAWSYACDYWRRFLEHHEVNSEKLLLSLRDERHLQERSNQLEFLFGKSTDTFVDVAPFPRDPSPEVWGWGGMPNYISTFSMNEALCMTYPITYGGYCVIAKSNDGLNWTAATVSTSNTTFTPVVPSWANAETQKRMAKKNSLLGTSTLRYPMPAFNDCYLYYSGRDFLGRSQMNDASMKTNPTREYSSVFFHSEALFGDFSELEIKPLPHAANKNGYMPDTSASIYRDKNGVIRAVVRKEIAYSRSCSGGMCKGWRGLAFLYQCEDQPDQWCELAVLHHDWHEGKAPTADSRNRNPQIYSNRVTKVDGVYYLTVAQIVQKSASERSVLGYSILPSDDGVWFDPRGLYRPPQIVSTGPMGQQLFAANFAGVSGLGPDLLVYQTTYAQSHSARHRLFQQGKTVEVILIQKKWSDRQMFGLGNPKSDGEFTLRPMNCTAGFSAIAVHSDCTTANIGVWLNAQSCKAEEHMVGVQKFMCGACPGSLVSIRVRLNACIVFAVKVGAMV